MRPTIFLFTAGTTNIRVTRNSCVDEPIRSFESAGISMRIIWKKVQGDTYRYNITTGGHENSWDLNPPSDLGFVELTFRLLLRYSEQLGVDTQRRALWTDIVTHLPQYKVIMPTKNRTKDFRSMPKRRRMGLAKSCYPTSPRLSL